MRRTLPTLLLATLLLPSVQADAGPVLLAWAPATSALPGEVLYEVYGVDGDGLTHLGSTGQTTFVAPGGFDGYRVKYQEPSGEKQVTCIIVDLSKPDVYIVC